MTKIRVKFRPSSIEGKTGTIYYNVAHRGTVRHITTKIRLMPEQWDERKQRLVCNGPDVQGLQNRINRDLEALFRVVRKLEDESMDFTVDEIVSRFRSSEHHVSVIAFFEDQIELLTVSNHLGTARNYRMAANALAAFLKGRDFYFSELTSEFIEQFSDYLMRKGMVRNSLSFYMRILRAIYNKAVRRGFARQTYPFSNVYTGVDRTRKRAIGEDVIMQLMKLDIAGNDSLSFARDMFLFSFYTRGMAYVDIAYLRKSDIQAGIIRYTRHKTGQQLAVRIEPCIQAIIDRYADAVKGLPYVFPILKSEEATECFRQYQTSLRLHNLRLHQLSESLGIDCNISSYTSRHSWATMARNCNVPISVISAGMGHSSERTTQIYLASLEDSLIDCANKGILDKFNSSVSS